MAWDTIKIDGDVVEPEDYNALVAAVKAGTNSVSVL